jgi:hypothetical protein
VGEDRDPRGKEIAEPDPPQELGAHPIGDSVDHLAAVLSRVDVRAERRGPSGSPRRFRETRRLRIRPRLHTDAAHVWLRSMVRAAGKTLSVAPG